MSNGWDSLSCRYFAEVCERTLLQKLSASGFTRVEASRSGVTFWRGDDFIALNYAAETYPNYAPLVGIGTLEKTKEGFDYKNEVPLWFMVPEESPLRLYFSWTFSSEDQLGAALQKIFDELIEPVALPMLADERAKESLYKRFDEYRQSRR